MIGSEATTDWLILKIVSEYLNLLMIVSSTDLYKTRHYQQTLDI